MKIFPLIKKVISGGTSAIISTVIGGFRFTLNALSAIVANPKVGAFIDATRQALRIDQKPAFLTSLLAVTGTIAQQAQNAAFSFTARIGQFFVQSNPSYEIVRTTIDLTRRVGANAQATISGQTAWTSPGNAIDGTNGIHNGTNATAAGSALGGTYGLELSYADSSGKSGLTISSAKLAFYAQATGDLGGLLVTTTLSYNIGAGWVVLETIAGNFSNLGTPREYVVPINTWAKHDALQTRVSSVFAAASVTAAAAVDAVEVEVVTAQLVDLL